MKAAPEAREGGALLSARRHAVSLVRDELDAYQLARQPAPAQAGVDALLRAAFDMSLELDRLLARIRKGTKR
jgi:hypothetical protein